MHTYISLFCLCFSSICFVCWNHDYKYKSSAFSLRMNYPCPIYSINLRSWKSNSLPSIQIDKTKLGSFLDFHPVKRKPYAQAALVTILNIVFMKNSSYAWYLDGLNVFERSKYNLLSCRQFDSLAFSLFLPIYWVCKL